MFENYRIDQNNGNFTGAFRLSMIGRAPITGGVRPFARAVAFTGFMGH